MFLAAFLLAPIPFPHRVAEKEAPARTPDAEAAIHAAAEPDYRIGPGDQLKNGGWQDKDLSRLMTVLPYGKVSYPMVGEIEAAGMTVSQLQKEI